jgi:hypothetical protein
METHGASVAVGAQGNQVLFGVRTETTAESLVMNLQFWEEPHTWQRHPSRCSTCRHRLA